MPIPAFSRRADAWRAFSASYTGERRQRLTTRLLMKGAPVDAGAALILFDAHLDTASKTCEDHPGQMGRL